MDGNAKFLTIYQAAREKGVGVRALERDARNGTLPVYRFDKWRRIARADLEAWVERHRQPARGEDRES
jgi:excisionase family DNA binding protein